MRKVIDVFHVSGFETKTSVYAVEEGFEFEGVHIELFEFGALLGAEAVEAGAVGGLLLVLQIDSHQIEERDTEIF